MAKIIGLPKLSPTMDEGTLVSWAKQEGDAVEIDDLLAEVETDKATMEFRSFDKGVLLKILVPAGETLAPDTPVAILGDKGEDISALIEEAKTAPKASAEEAQAQNRSPTEGVGAEPVKQAGPTSADPAHAGPPRGSPLVRKLARERGLDLSRVAGSGPRGRIIKRDLDGISGPARVRRTASREPRVEKVSQMRKTIARRLTESTQQVPHYYLTIDCDVAALLEARRAINEEYEADGQKISVNDLLIKACAVALRRFPAANASFRGDTIIYHGRVDISVAVAMPDGLITPVVRDADQKSVFDIAREVRDLAARARDKKLAPEEFTDGTFSISNLGMFGIEEFTAVINTPEGAILAVGAIRDEAVVKDAQIVSGKRMRMTMSCDHRVIDGAVGAQYLAVLKRLIEAPATMFV